jgi:pyruvate dehydrogenase E1 component alpha subunit
VYDAVQTAVDRARAGGGPTFIEAVTYRWRGHSKSDKNLYRTREEIESWRELDPIPAFEAKLLEAGTVNETDLSRIHDEVRTELRSAVQRANAAPDASAGELLSAVYAR